MDALLQVKGLSVSFRSRRRLLQAVREVSFDIDAGDSLGVLGESGSGKSVTALAIMGLLDPKRTVIKGEVLFEDVDLLRIKESRRGSFRGGKIGMVFEDALAALNPVQTVGSQIGEVLTYHARVSHRQARLQAIQLMERVGIPAPATRYGSYPHEMSGGMRQRIMVAIALAARPRLLIADEPTTSLDVTVQAQIIDLLKSLRAESDMSVMFITHDLGLSLELVDRLAVMYAGRVVESGPAREVYSQPTHPYTRGLVDSMPRRTQKGDRLKPIPGSPPSLIRLPSGCPFHPRCPVAIQACTETRPELRLVRPGHDSACHLVSEAG